MLRISRVQRAELALEHAGVEELLEHGVVRLADLPERHDAVLLPGEWIVGDLPCDADDLGHRVLERPECLVERLSIGALGSLGIQLAHNARQIMPLDLDAVLTLQPNGEVVKADLVILGDDGTDA